MEPTVNWTLARAKNQLSEVIRQALEQGPQTISVGGREMAVVISKADYDHREKPRGHESGRNEDRQEVPSADPSGNFKEFLLSIPSLEGVDLSRDQTPARDIDLT